MTSLEWVEVKKRLHRQESAITEVLAQTHGPNDEPTPDGKSMQRSDRGRLVDELGAIQSTRNGMRPKHRR